MTNFEKYKDDLMKIEGHFAIDKAQRRIAGCMADGLEECINCKDCLFNDTEYCLESDKIKWLYEEYEPPVLSDDELELIKALEKAKKTKYRFIVRMKSGRVVITCDKPYMDDVYHTYRNDKNAVIIDEHEELFQNIDFNVGPYDIENKCFV